MNQTISSRLKNAISPHEDYCAGYLNSNQSYITAPVIGIGVTNKQQRSNFNEHNVDKIIAYDSAEVDQAYIGQINMIKVSSFCGPNGLLWGYDLAKTELEEPKTIANLPTHSLGNILKASVELFGTIDNKNYPLLPGSHVPTAYKSVFSQGKGTVYGAIAIAIPKDREKNAILFMEDAGFIDSFNSNAFVEEITYDLINSIKYISQNQKVEYSSVLFGIRTQEVQETQMGCALVAIPYFTLAKKAYHPGLHTLSLDEWSNLNPHESLL